MKPLFNKVTIIGIGLIGGSLGMAIKNKKCAKSVIGVDLGQEILDLALELEAIEEGLTDVIKGVQDADLVLLAAPIGTSMKILDVIAPHLKVGCLVTDVGSTKVEIIKKAAQVLPPGVFFLGGHPMAGSEQAGIKGADQYLFENAVYILTPDNNLPEEPVASFRNLCEIIGAKVIEMSAEKHDFLVAGISHLPHIVAATLVNTIGKVQENNPEILALAAGGFRDTTRIASGHPLMWRDICTTNKGQIMSLIKSFKETLNEMEEKILQGDDVGIEEELTRARKIRSSIPAKMKGYLPVLYEITIFVPDRPGIIGQVAAMLGYEGININDIEILRVKEGEGGSIRLGFGTPEEQSMALEIFKRNKIKAKIKA